MRRSLLGSGLATLALLSLAAEARAGAPRKDEIPDAFTVDEQVQGEKFKDFRSLRGKVVIVNVFTLQVQGDPAGIINCGKELEKLWQEGKTKGLVVIGVSSDSKSMIQEFISKSKVTYPILRSDDMRRVWDLKTVPENLVLNAQGRCVSYEVAIDVKNLNEMVGAIKPEDLKPKEDLTEVPKGDFSKKFDPVWKAYKAGDYKAAGAELAKLEKDAAEADNAKGVVKRIHDLGLLKLDDAAEAERIEDFMGARDIYEALEKRWPPADDVAKTAKEKLAALKKDKNSDSARVIAMEKTWEKAQAAEAKGDKDRAVDFYQKCVDACPGTKFAQKCKDKIAALAPKPAPGK